VFSFIPQLLYPWGKYPPPPIPTGQEAGWGLRAGLDKAVKRKIPFTVPAGSTNKLYDGY